MGSLNKVLLIGNVGRDPEVRFTQGGQCVANFSMATADRFKDSKDGQWKERAEWHRVVVWGKLAETVRDYVKKGRSLYVEGRLQTRSWQDQQGVTKYTTEVVANTLQFLGQRGAGDGDSQGYGDASASSGEPIGAPASGPDDFPSIDDDVPF